MREKIKETLKKIDTDKLVDTVGDVVSSSFKLLKEVGKAAEVGFEVVEIAANEGIDKIKKSVKKEKTEEDVTEEKEDSEDKPE